MPEPPGFDPGQVFVSQATPWHASFWSGRKLLLTIRANPEQLPNGAIARVLGYEPPFAAELWPDGTEVGDPQTPRRWAAHLQAAVAAGLVLPEVRYGRNPDRGDVQNSV